MERQLSARGGLRSNKILFDLKGEKMSETIIIALICTSLGLLNDAKKPKEYSLELAGGKSENVLIESNGKYACPTYCSTDHLHTAILCNSDINSECSDNHNSYQVNTSVISKEKMSFKGQIVLAMERVENVKQKKPSVTQALVSK